jgi:hypothetical protein
MCKNIRAGEAILEQTAQYIVDMLEEPFDFIKFLLSMTDKSHFYSLKNRITYEESQSYFFIRIINDIIIPWFVSTKGKEVDHIAEGLEELYQMDHAEGYHDAFENMLNVLDSCQEDDSELPDKVIVFIKVMNRIGRDFFRYEQTINQSIK